MNKEVQIMQKIDAVLEDLKTDGVIKKIIGENITDNMLNLINQGDAPAVIKYVPTSASGNGTQITVDFPYTIVLDNPNQDLTRQELVRIRGEILERFREIEFTGNYKGQAGYLPQNSWLATAGFKNYREPTVKNYALVDFLVQVMYEQNCK